MNQGCVLIVVAKMCRCCVMVLAAVLSVGASGDKETIIVWNRIN